MPSAQTASLDRSQWEIATCGGGDTITAAPISRFVYFIVALAETGLKSGPIAVQAANPCGSPLLTPLSASAQQH